MPIARLALELSGLLAICIAASPASGFTLIDGSETRCVIRIDDGDYPVPEEYVGNGRVGERHPELGGSAAVVRRGEGGRPKIVFDRFVLDSIRARLPFAHDFVFFHECAHIQRQTLDEIEANCHALNEVRRLALVDADLEAALGEFHIRMGRLPLKYGGSGERFWRQTLACVESPEPLPGSPTAWPGGMFEPPFAP
jgi:hypothetical protein